MSSDFERWPVDTMYTSRVLHGEPSWLIYRKLSTSSGKMTLRQTLGYWYKTARKEILLEHNSAFKIEIHWYWPVIMISFC
jgi:hypothetical protein